MTRAARLCLGVATVALAASACDGSSGYLEERARQRRMASLGIERFDSAAAYDLAGMSTHRRIEIEALKPRSLGADTLDPAYRTLHMRCGSCHDVPAPDSRPGYLWDASMTRMKKNARDAGLMPISAEDEAEVLRFLREHASDRR